MASNAVGVAGAVDVDHVELVASHALEEPSERGPGHGAANTGAVSEPTAPTEEEIGPVGDAERSMTVEQSCGTEVAGHSSP